jgi:uncharacterized membrane protein
METIERSIEVEAPVEKVYNQWTHFEEFPRFMGGVEEVQLLDDRHLHWIANIGGKRKEWDAEIVELIPDDRIAWRSISGAPNSGVVHFRSKDHEHTVLTVRMSYQPRGWVENLGSSLGMFSRKIEADLRSFKNFIQRRLTQTISSRGRDPSQSIDESYENDGNEHVVDR